MIQDSSLELDVPAMEEVIACIPNVCEFHLYTDAIHLPFMRRIPGRQLTKLVIHVADDHSYALAFEAQTVNDAVRHLASLRSFRLVCLNRESVSPFLAALTLSPSKDDLPICPVLEVFRLSRSNGYDPRDAVAFQFSRQNHPDAVNCCFVWNPVDE